MVDGSRKLLDGRVVLVTGGSSGIGRATAVACAHEGAVVVTADIRREPREGGEPTVELIERQGGMARHVDCDLRRSEDIEGALKVADGFGGVSVLVNNAGVVHQQRFLEVTPGDFDSLMEMNVRVPFFVAQAAARRMVASGRGGSIINMSSVAGIRGRRRLVTYSASKGAIRLMTYALADELGSHGIRVNAVHPGAIGTSMLLEDLGAGDAPVDSVLARRGTPEDVADAVVYLASDQASFVTGTSLVVDGGSMLPGRPERRAGGTEGQ